ncbi:hypothetical protein MJC1_00973 [Methylocystis sp. MJC1]|nr:hypothetical protein MJC1_00973 [Methylocystis sp. MJC1]
MDSHAVGVVGVGDAFMRAVPVAARVEPQGAQGGGQRRRLSGAQRGDEGRERKAHRQLLSRFAPSPTLPRWRGRGSRLAPLPRMLIASVPSPVKRGRDREGAFQR